MKMTKSRVFIYDGKLFRTVKAQFVGLCYGCQLENGCGCEIQYERYKVCDDETIFQEIRIEDVAQKLEDVGSKLFIKEAYNGI